MALSQIDPVEQWHLARGVDLRQHRIETATKNLEFEQWGQRPSFLPYRDDTGTEIGF